MTHDCCCNMPLTNELIQEQARDPSPPSPPYYLQ